jgi:hypothetical protein
LPASHRDDAATGLSHGYARKVVLGCPRKSTSANFEYWSIDELRLAFGILREQHDVPLRFFFQIDGLDEYDEDRYEVIEIMKHISKASCVKLLVSSRPWLCFERAYGGSAECRKLYLHHLTEKDIKLFPRETLERYTVGLHIEDWTLCQDLIAEITKRAQGVFLWVYLVIRSLRNGSTMVTLLLYYRADYVYFLRISISFSIMIWGRSNPSTRSTLRAPSW